MKATPVGQTMKKKKKSVACHPGEVGLQLARVSSYQRDALVISYKSLSKDEQECHVNSSLKQTHIS